MAMDSYHPDNVYYTPGSDFFVQFNDPDLHEVLDITVLSYRIMVRSVSNFFG
jgi:hypothetical protein